MTNLNEILPDTQRPCKANGCLIDAAAKWFCDECWENNKSKEYAILEGVKHFRKLSGDDK